MTLCTAEFENHALLHCLCLPWINGGGILFPIVNDLGVKALFTLCLWTSPLTSMTFAMSSSLGVVCSQVTEILVCPIPWLDLYSC